MGASGSREIMGPFSLFSWPEISKSSGWSSTGQGPALGPFETKDGGCKGHSILHCVSCLVFRVFLLLDLVCSCLRCSFRFAVFNVSVV